MKAVRSFVSRTHGFTDGFGTVTEQYSHGGPMRITGDGGSIVVSVEYAPTPNAPPDNTVPYGAAVVLYGCVHGGGARTPLATGYATSARMTPTLTVGGMPFDWFEVDLYVKNGTARVIATRSAGGSSQPYARPVVGAEVAPGHFPGLATVPGFPTGAIKWAEPQPQATQLSDTDPNPSTTRFGANLLGWDPVGLVWRRVKVAADGTIAPPAGTTTWIDPGAGSAASGSPRVVAGVAWECSGANNGTTKVWIHFFDAAARPVDGTRPFESIPVVAGGTFSRTWLRARKLANGFTWAASSTPDALTYANSALCWVNFEGAN